MLIEPNANYTPTLDNERVPTQEELRHVLNSDKTPLRTRASIAIMAFSGCRPEVQGNYLGVDGLKIKDLPELEITKDSEVRFLRIPTIVIVRAEISKIRKQYFSFLPEEGCEILKTYFERRIQNKEKLTPNSGVIVTSTEQANRSSHFGVTDSSPFLRTPKVRRLPAYSFQRAI